MENKLRKLFDYQKFERSPELDALIAQTHARYGEEISEDDLEHVAAAGEPDGEKNGWHGIENADPTPTHGPRTCDTWNDKK